MYLVQKTKVQELAQYPISQYGLRIKKHEERVQQEPQTNLMPSGVPVTQL